jgi:hypothetical protein
MRELTPEQTDPVAYQLAALKIEMQALAEANSLLTLESPREIEQHFWNLARIDQYEADIRELEFKIELRSRPVSVTKKHLTLVWSQD